MLKLILFAAVLSTSLCAHAALHKCRSADGKIEYTDQPCAIDTQITVSIVESAATSGQVFHDNEVKLRQREARAATEERVRTAQDQAAAAHGKNTERSENCAAASLAHATEAAKRVGKGLSERMQQTARVKNLRAAADVACGMAP